VSARVKEVVDAVHVLATLARFKPADGEGGEKPQILRRNVGAMGLNRD
jgi:hypothetical protein